MPMNMKKASEVASECQYIVLDQRLHLNGSALAFQNKFYDFWKNYWNQILLSVGIDEPIEDEEFFRQHKITALIHDDEIVVMHLLSCYERESFSTEPYFQKFDPQFREAIENAPIRRLLTMQYMAFNPGWKHIKCKPIIFLPVIVASLSLRHQQCEGADAVVSVARSDLGVTNALSKMGFHAALPDGSFNNTPVSYRIAYSPNAYPCDEAIRLADSYWDNRIEISLSPFELHRARETRSA